MVIRNFSIFMYPFLEIFFNHNCVLQDKGNRIASIIGGDFC